MDYLDFHGGLYWLVLLGAAGGTALVEWARRHCQSTIEEYGAVLARCGLTGGEVAKRLLAAGGLSDVRLVRTDKIDRYEPRTKEIHLRADRFDSPSLASVAIAAHEVGHAQQFAEGMLAARLRRVVGPVCLLLIIAALAILACSVSLLPATETGPPVVVLCFLIVLLQLPVVLPLEFDAWRRARELLRRTELIAPEEEPGFERVLKAAARTYVAEEIRRWIVLIVVILATLWLPSLWSENAVPPAPIDPTALDELPGEPESIPLLPFLDLGNIVVLALVLFIFTWCARKSKTPGKSLRQQAVEHNNQAMALYREGALAMAVDEYTKALRLDPALHAAYFNRGTCYMQLGRLDEALADFDASIRLSPAFGEAYTGRAEVRLRRREVDPARADFDEAVRLAPQNTSSLFCRANFLLQRGEYDRALADLDRALQCGGPDPNVLALRGNTWLAKNEYDRAIADFTQALENRADAAGVLRDRGLAWYHKGNLARALADLDEAVRRAPADAVALNNRGAALLRAGHYARAIADLREALRLQPDFANPHKHLAWLQATCPEAAFRDGAAAVASARRALELAGDARPADWLGVLAAAYAEAADFAQAVQSQMLCVEQTPPEARARARQRLDLYEASQPWREPAG